MPRNFVIILLILFDIFILFVLKNHINTTYTEDRNDNILLKIIHNITAKKTLNIAFYLKILPVYDGGQIMEFEWIINVLLGKIDRPLKIISGDEAKYNPQNNTLHVGFTYPGGDFYTKLKERGFVNQGAFHMGDEVNAHDVTYYTTASYVFRNYYNKDYEQRFSNSHFVPLGTKSGYGSLPENSLLPSSQRIYVANFIGSLKANGKEMVDKIKERNFTTFLNYDNDWESKDGIHVIDYRNILRESIFTLCPWGNNPESLQLYEAMEAGSIPIFQRLNASISPMTPMGADNPIPQFENWSDAIDFIDKMRENFSELEKLQQRIISFYKSYKESMQLKIRLVIDKAFKESHGYYC